MVPPQSNPPPIFVVIFNAYINHIVHPTFLDHGDSISYRIMLSTIEGKMEQSKVISHCIVIFDNNNSVQQTTHNDDPLILASNC